jgi:catechol 2,3-dioxygenase-like lactoylglutathione lyase family enzyme
MSAQLNHTIVWSRDKARSAGFLADILGRPAPKPFARFLVVELDNDASLDFADAQGDIARQHYAFLVDDAEFDAAFARIRDRSLTYWADPGRSRPNEINRRDGGRGCYFEDPDGHLMEILTRPYGSA